MLAGNCLCCFSGHAGPETLPPALTRPRRSRAGRAASVRVRLAETSFVDFALQLLLPLPRENECIQISPLRPRPPSNTAGGRGRYIHVQASEPRGGFVFRVHIRYDAKRGAASDVLGCPRFLPGPCTPVRIEKRPIPVCRLASPFHTCVLPVSLDTARISNVHFRSIRFSGAHRRCCGSSHQRRFFSEMKSVCSESPPRAREGPGRGRERGTDDVSENVAPVHPCRGALLSYIE